MPVVVKNALRNWEACLWPEVVDYAKVSEFFLALIKTSECLTYRICQIGTR